MLSASVIYTVRRRRVYQLVKRAVNLGADKAMSGEWSAEDRADFEKAARIELATILGRLYDLAGVGGPEPEDAETDEG